jgi:pimeloyl-ACP methyl ester carboxylesterase
VARLTVAGLRDELARLRGRPAHRLAIAGPPGSVAAMTSPGAVEGYDVAYDGAHWENWVAGRIALWVGLYRPGRRAAEIRCPWLVQVCTGDPVTPARPAVAAAARAPRSQVLRYEGDHFTLFQGAAFERAVSDQLAFLERILPGLQQPTAAATS